MSIYPAVERYVPAPGEALSVSIRRAFDTSERIGVDVVFEHGGRAYRIIAGDWCATVECAFASGAAFALEHGHA